VARGRFRQWLVAIAAVGAVWRLGYLFAAKLHDALLLNDSLYYSMQAGRNSEGDWFREALTALPGAEHGPLTVLYLTPWSVGAGANPPWQRFATTLVGIAAVFLIGLLGERLAGPRVGLVAAGIAAVYPNLWVNDSLVMSESLAILIVAGALVVALDFDRRPGVWRAAALGVLVGLGALTRTEIVLFAVGFAALAWWRSAGHPRRALMPVLILGATAVTVAPWVTYNLARFDEPVLLTTNGERTLLGANCDSTYYDDVGGWDIRCLSAVPAVEGDDPSVGASRRREVALDYVGDHLDRVPVVVAARVGRLLDVYGLESLVALDVGEEKARWAVWAGIVAWWVLAPLAMIGWVVAGRDDDLDPRRRAARWWLVVPLATVLITSVLFYGAHRIRAPAEPVVVVLAAVGVIAVIDRIRRMRRRGTSSGLVEAGDADRERAATARPAEHEVGATGVRRAGGGAHGVVAEH
jgi:4-amino-4-deoxy-L-arabinose transferase-like glycosyltransferase